ncbi:MAG: hypothetical protein Kow00127_12170 [Bacteroidales bacterium]
MKFYSIFSIVLLAGAIHFNLSASEPAGDPPFSGIIYYEITYPGANFDQQMMAMLPSSMKMSCKGHRSRTDLATGMGNNITIFDSEKMEGVTLMDMMGQKFAIEMTKAQIDEEMSKLEDIEVNETGETRDIAGYACKKAVITYKQDGKAGKQEVWYTTELGEGPGYGNNLLFNQIKGIMMEFAINDSGMTMKMTATRVEKKKVPEKTFDRPDGYKTVTQQELQNMFGGGY